MKKPIKMKIDQFPVEILMKITKYLPTYEEIAKVNRRFYSVVRRVNDSNIYLRTDEWFLQRVLSDNAASSQWLKSILTTNRQISKLEIKGRKYLSGEFTEREICGIISILEKFAATMKVLRISCVTIDELNYLKILSMIPNVERLELIACSISETSTTYRQRLSNDELNLKKLKYLKIVSCDKEFVDVFHCLPVGVLKEVEATCHWDILASIFDRQLKINTLKVVWVLTEEDASSVTIAQILSNQPEITSLFLSGVTVDEQLMDAVADNSELEVLTINMSWTSISCFAKIWKLKKLKDLTIECFDDEIESTAKFEKLANSDNTSIEKLSFLGSSRMSNHLISELAKSTPNLKHLNILQHSLKAKTEVDAIMIHFNFVEVLKLRIWDEVPIVDPGNYYNPKLRELSIWFLAASHFYDRMPKLIASFPNLTKLSLKIQLPQFPLNVRRILNAFPKLKSLKIEAASDLFSTLCVGDLDYIIDQKNNLEFVSLVGASRAVITSRLLKKLRTNFNVYASGRIVNMAVDHYTMNRECRFPSRFMWKRL